MHAAAHNDTTPKTPTPIDGARQNWASAPATGWPPSSSHASVAHTATRPSSQGPTSALRFNYYAGLRAVCRMPNPPQAGPKIERRPGLSRSPSSNHDVAWRIVPWRSRTVRPHTRAHTHSLGLHRASWLNYFDFDAPFRAGGWATCDMHGRVCVRQRVACPQRTYLRGHVHLLRFR